MMMMTMTTITIAIIVLVVAGRTLDAIGYILESQILWVKIIGSTMPSIS